MDCILCQQRPSKYKDGTCHRCYQRRWRQENPEKYLTAIRRWLEANYERLYEIRRTWRRAHLGYMCAASKRYRRDHPERVREYQKRYRAEHKQQIREYDLQRRARVRKAFVEKIDIETIFARDNGRCGICHRPVNKKRASLDHIIPLAEGGSHSMENAQVAHLRCNHKRGRGWLPAQIRLV